MAMNNYILQKIIHAYQNGGADLCLPHYIDYESHGDEVILDVTKERVHSLKLLSKGVQQSAKFFVDMSGEQLSGDEIFNCLSDVEIYLPYPVTFIQFKHEEGYVNSLFVESGEGIDWKGNHPSNFMVSTILSDLSGNQMTWDMLGYHHYDIEMSEDGIVTGETKPMGLGSNFISNLQSVIDFESAVMKWYLKFMVMLNYPEITVADEVLGRPNNTFGHVPVKNMKRSTLTKKPKYQHKTLVLDMFGDKSGGESCSGGRSKGTAFHSVRKHLRQYKNGKKVFVKAHFRGSKEVGMIFKDYKIDTE